MTGSPLIPLKPEHIDRTGDLFGRALYDDPLTCHLVPDPARRHRFQHIFRCYIRYGYLYGHVTVPEDLTGVVVSIPPGQYAFTLGRLLRIGFLRLPLEFGFSLTHRVWTTLTCFERHHQQDMPTPHWYLLAIGVDPLLQCKGIGSALLQTVLVEADQTGHPCYLESTSERNIAFYERHGFRVLRRGEIPGGGPPYWTMLREALS